MGSDAQYMAMNAKARDGALQSAENHSVNNEGSIRVRMAKLEDIANIRSLLFQLDALHFNNLPECFKSPGDIAQTRDNEFFVRLINSNTACLLLAERCFPLTTGDQEVSSCGFALATVSQSESQLWQPRSKGIIHHLVVAESERRKGVGRKLVEGIERWFELAGAETIELTVYDFNQVASTFYQSLGYLPESIRMQKQARSIVNVVDSEPNVKRLA